MMLLGTGVAMKFGAQINRIQAARDNVGNAIAFAQTQDGFLEKIGNALDRMSELAMLAQDETKTNADRAFMTRNFKSWMNLSSTSRSKTFNGVSLFSGGSMTMNVTVSDGTTFGKPTMLTYLLLHTMRLRQTLSTPHPLLQQP